MKRAALTLILCASWAWGAAGDITAVRVLGSTCTAGASCNGWVAEIDIDGLSTGGTYNFGLGANNNPSTAKIVFTVTSPGYDTSGSTTTIQRTVYGTQWLRKPYPNEASKDEAESGGTLTVRVSLSDFIYSGDTATVTIASGFYTGSNAVTALAVTNNSTLAYPKPVGRWAWVPYTRETGDFLLEATAFHRFAKDKKPLAALKYTCTDGSATVTATVNDMTVSTRTGDANNVLVYAATIPVTSLAQGATVTCNFTAYPWVGDANALLNSNLVADGGDGFAQPSEQLGPFAVLLDKTGAYGSAFAVVDPASTAASAAVYSSQAAAESAYAGNVNTAYATIKAATDALKAYNNSNYSRNEAGGATVLLAAANHEALGAAAVTMGTMTSWLTITRLSTITASQAVINVNTSNRTWNAMRLKLEGVTISGTSALLLFGSTTTTALWLDQNIINLTPASGGIVSWVAAYATRNTVTAYTLGFKHNGTTKCPYALIRGNTGPSSGAINAHLYNVIGNHNITPNEEMLTANAQGQAITANAIVAFNTLLNLNAATTPIQLFSAVPSTTDLNNFAVVQNVLENRLATSPLMDIAAGEQQIHPSNNVIIWHNTFAGARQNLAYNGYGSTAYLHTNYSQVGNIFHDWNIKSDNNNSFDSPNGGRTGDWPVMYMAGSHGNAFRASTTFPPAFYGLYSPTAITLGYVSDKSSTGDAAGNGNYHLTSSSSALNLLASGRAVLPYDLDGVARRNDGTGAAGAYEYGSSRNRYIVIQ